MSVCSLVDSVYAPDFGADAAESPQTMRDKSKPFTESDLQQWKEASAQLRKLNERASSQVVDFGTKEQFETSFLEWWNGIAVDNSILLAAALRSVGGQVTELPLINPDGSSSKNAILRRAQRINKAGEEVRKAAVKQSNELQKFNETVAKRLEEIEEACMRKRKELTERYNQDLLKVQREIPLAVQLRDEADRQMKAIAERQMSLFNQNGDNLSGDSLDQFEQLAALYQDNMDVFMEQKQKVDRLDERFADIQDDLAMELKALHQFCQNVAETLRGMRNETNEHRRLFNLVLINSMVVLQETHENFMLVLRMLRRKQEADKAK